MSGFEIEFISAMDRLGLQRLISATVRPQIFWRNGMVCDCAKRVRLIAIVAVALAAPLWAQEAPRSFSSQNGLLTPQQLEEARQEFENVRTPAAGLGIHFNENSCAACHVGG